MMTNGVPRNGFFYPTLIRIMDSFSLLTTVFILFIYLFKNKLPEVPEYAKMHFHMMALLDVLGKMRVWMGFLVFTIH